MDRRGFIRLAVGSVIVVPTVGRFLVACSSDDSDPGTPGDTTPPAAAPVVQGSDVVFSSSQTEGHFHTLPVDGGDLTSPSEPISGSVTTASSHTHSISISVAQLQSVAAGETVKVTTGAEVGHSHVLTLLKVSGVATGDSGAGGGGGGGTHVDAGGDGGGGGGNGYPY